MQDSETTLPGAQALLELDRYCCIMSALTRYRSRSLFMHALPFEQLLTKECVLAAALSPKTA